MHLYILNKMPGKANQVPAGYINNVDLSKTLKDITNWYHGLTAQLVSYGNCPIGIMG